MRLYARQFDASAADDLVHEAFLALARQPRWPEPVLPWLYRAVRHRAIEAARAHARRRRRETIVATREPWFVPTEDRFEADEAAAALAELPLEQREIIVARIWGGLTFEEIASLVGCGLSTTFRRYQAGLAELKARLEGSHVPDPR